MNLALGISLPAATLLSYVAGFCEIAIGLAVLAFPKLKWPLLLTIALMVALLGYAAWADAALALGAFNPVTINAAVAALAIVALLLEAESGAKSN